jgi:hypothetical protein
LKETFFKKLSRERSKKSFARIPPQPKKKIGGKTIKLKKKRKNSTKKRK